jgi:hypothetical protein
MQRNLLCLLLIAAVITSVISCSSADKSGIAIPKDASFVLHINASSITSKVNWQEIQQTDWFKNMYAGENDSLTKKLMDDPSNTGIDLKSDLAFFVKKQGQGGYSAFEGSVSNEAAFEAFNKKINKDAAVSKNGDINIMKLGDGKGVLAWNGKRFVYIMDTPMGGLSDRLQGGDSAYAGPYAFPIDSLQKFGVQLFDLEKKNSLTSDERFASLIKEQGDVHFWANAEQYSDMLGGFLSVLKLNVLFEDNVSATTLNFENGKITMKTKSYYNKELRDLMDKYPPGEISNDIINRIPSQNVAAVFVMKYPPAGLKDLIKLIGVDGLVNSELGKLGFSIDEFIKANKGDMLLTVTDFTFGEREVTIPNPEGEPYTMKTTSPDAKVLFATSVNDKAAFEKMIGVMKAQIPEQIQGSLKTTYQLNDTWFAAGNSPEQVNAFLAGGNNKHAFAGRITGKAFGGYIDVQKLLQSSKPAMTDSGAIAMMDASIAMWQDIVVTSGGKKDNSITSEAEINLVDKNTNSLKQLNKWFDTMSKISKQKNHAYDSHTKQRVTPAVVEWASY